MKKIKSIRLGAAFLILSMILSFSPLEAINVSASTDVSQEVVSEELVSETSPNVSDGETETESESDVPLQETAEEVDSQVSTAINAENIVVSNYVSGISDKIIVTDLKAGDVINVYDASSQGNLLGTASEANGTATIITTQLGIGAGKIYVTVTSTDLTESSRTEKDYISEPITWQIYDHTGNWGEVVYPNGDQNPNGSTYNNHIILKNNGSRVTFYGYGSPAYKDFIFLPSDTVGKKTFTFDMDISKVNYHSMEGGGFLFNTKIENEQLSGYAILFTGTAYSNDKYIKLFKIDNVNASAFHEDGSRMMQGYPGVTLLKSYQTPAGDDHSIKIEATRNSIEMWDNGDDDEHKIINETLDTVYGDGIGLIASYAPHGCSMLSYFTISNLNIQGTRYSWPILDLLAQPGNEQAILSFSELTGAEEIVLQQSTDGENYTTATTKSPITPDSTTTVVTGLTNGQKYFFRLLVGGGTNEGISNITSATPKKMIDDLNAAGGNKVANLTFTAPKGATNVIVQKSTDGQNYTPATLSEPITEDSTSAKVNGLTNGQTYYFKLIVTGGEYDGTSNMASATPAKAQVNLTATAGNAQVNLTFPALIGATNILVEQSTDGETYTQSTIATPITGDSTNATVTGLTNGQQYSFRLVITGGEYDGTSSVASATPKKPTTSPTEPSNKVEEINIDVKDGENGKVVSNAKIERTTKPDGTKKDKVNYPSKSAEETVNKLLESGEKKARIIIPDKNDEVSEVEVNIPKESLDIIAKGKVSLEIDTENAKISIPNKSISGISDNVYFRVVPIKTENLRKEVEKRAKTEKIVREAAKDNSVYVVSRPATIETNMTSRVVDITLPLRDVSIPNDSAEREKFLSNLVVFIEHSDGDKALAKGKIVPYKDGLLGIQFRINKFSTFTILNMENWKQYFDGIKAEEIYGKDRYETAISISQKGWNKANTVVIARGDDYADALTGVPLAYQLDAPILLTKKTSLNEEVKAEIIRLEAKNIVILGGTGAVAENVENTLEDLGLSVQRMGGKNRYETAALIASKLKSENRDKAVIVSGENFADALSASSYAAINGYPVLLTTKNVLPSYTKQSIDSLGISKVILVGGEGRISKAVEAKLPVENRLAGLDRYDSSLKVAKHFNLDTKEIAIATGEDFADAITGAVLVAKKGNAMLLVKGNVKSEPVISINLEEYINDMSLEKITVFGGSGAINTQVADEIKKLIK